MQPLETVAWVVWQHASWTVWPRLTSPLGDTACGTDTESSNKKLSMAIKLRCPTTGLISTLGSSPDTMSQWT